MTNLLVCVSVLYVTWRMCAVKISARIVRMHSHTTEVKQRAWRSPKLQEQGT